MGASSCIGVPDDPTQWEADKERLNFHHNNLLKTTKRDGTASRLSTDATGMKELSQPKNGMPLCWANTKESPWNQSGAKATILASCFLTGTLGWKQVLTWTPPGLSRLFFRSHCMSA